MSRPSSLAVTKAPRLCVVCGSPDVVNSHLMPAAFGRDMKGKGKNFWIGTTEKPGKIAGLQDTHDELVRTGMLAKISRCGAAAKPCIRVQEPTAFGDQGGDYRIIFGY